MSPLKGRPDERDCNNEMNLKDLRIPVDSSVQIVLPYWQFSYDWSYKRKVRVALHK